MADQINPTTGLAEEKPKQTPLGQPRRRLSDSVGTVTAPDASRQVIGLNESGQNYDFTITRGFNIDERRALAQPLAEKYAKGLGRVLNSAAFSLLDGAGMLYGIGEAIAYQDSSRIFQNAVLENLEKAKESIDESLLKVYVPPSVQNGDFLDKIGSASFWTTEAADTLGFALAMLVPGQGVKALKLGQRLAGTKVGGAIEAAGSRLAQNLNMPSKFKPGWLSGATNSASAVAINTVYEAGAEAMNTYDTLYDQVINEGRTIEKAKQIAGEGASGVFTANMALLAASNTLFERFVFKGFNAAAGSKIAKKSAKKSSTLEEFVEGLQKITRKEALKEYGKRSVGGFLSEGFLEEGTQFAIEDFASKKALDQTDEDWVEGVLKTYGENIFTNTDMNISVFLGGLFGMGMSAPGTASEIRGANRAFFGTEEKTVSKLRKFLGGQDIEASKGLKELYQQNMVEMHKDVSSFIEKNGEKFAEDENGRLKIDPVKFRTFIQQKARQEKMIAEAALALENGDQKRYEWIQAQVAFNTFHDTLNNAYGEEMLKELIPRMAEKAANTIQQEIAPGTNIETIQKDVQKRLEIYADLAQKAVKVPQKPVKVEGGTVENKLEFERLVQHARQGTELEKQFEESFKEDFEEGSPEEKSYLKKMADLERMENQFNDPKELQKEYNIFLKSADNLNNMEKDDVYSKDEKVYRVIDKKNGVFTLVNLEDSGDVIKTSNPEGFEYQTTLEAPEELPTLPESATTDKFIDFLNKTRMETEGGKANLINAMYNEFKDQIDSKELLEKLDQINDPQIRNFLGMFIPINQPTSTGNIQTATGNNIRGRYLSETFFPTSPPDGARTIEHEMFDGALLHLFGKQELRLELELDSQYPTGIRAVLTNKEGQPIDYNGNITSTKLWNWIPEAWNGTSPLTGRLKQAADNYGQDEFNKANTIFSEQRQRILDRLKAGEPVSLKIDGHSTGIPMGGRTFAEMNQGRTTPRGKLVTVQTGSEAGSVMLDGTRYYGIKLSTEDKRTLAYILEVAANSDDFYKTIRETEGFQDTLTNLVYYRPDNPELGVIKFENEKVMFRTGNDWSVPTINSKKAFMRHLSNIHYQIYSDKRKPFKVTYFNDAGQVTNTIEIPKEQYQQHAIDNYLVTYDYAPAMVGNTFVYPRKNVYPYVNYNSVTASGVVQSSLSLGSTQQSQTQPVVTQVPQQPAVTNHLGNVVGFLDAKPAENSDRAFAVDEEDSVIEVIQLSTGEFVGRINIMNTEAFENVAESFGGYFEVEGAVNASNIEVVERVQLAKISEDTYRVIKRGKLAPRQMPRKVTDPQYRVHDKAKVEKDLKRMFGDTYQATFLSDLISKGLHGYMQNGAIVLDENAEEGTHYHEAFHLFTQHALTVKERSELYKYGTEEELAEQYREWSITKDSKHSLVKFFNKILAAVQALLGIGNRNRNYLNSTYRNLYYGRAKRRLDLSKPSNIHYRRTDEFSDTELATIADSILGQSVKVIMANNANVMNLSSTIDRKSLDRATRQILGSLVENPELAAAFASNGKDINQHIQDIIKNKDIIYDIVTTKASILGLQVESEEEIPEDEAKNNEGWDKDDFQRSVVDSIPARIRLLLAGMADMKKVRRPDGTVISVQDYDYALGTPRFINPKQAFTILGNVLQGSTTLEEMVTKLNEKRAELSEYEDFDFILDLFEYIGITNGQINPTPRTFDLQTEFQQAFANQPYSFQTFFAYGNRLTSSDSTDSRIQREINTRWRSAFMSNREKNAIRIANDFVHDPQKNMKLGTVTNSPISADNWKQYVKYMEFLGIDYPGFYDKRGKVIKFARADALFGHTFTDLRASLAGVFSWIRPGNTTNIHNVEYGQANNQVRAAYSKLKELYKQMVLFGRENQFIDLNNNTRYTLGRHHHLSNQIHKMNQALSMEFYNDQLQAIDQVFFDGNSAVKEKMKSGAVASIELQTIEGMKDGVNNNSSEYVQASEEEQIAMYLNNLEDNKYPIIRTSDNSQERTFILRDNQKNILNIVDENFQENVFNHLVDTLNRIAIGEVKLTKEEIPMFEFLSEDLKNRLLTEDAEQFRTEVANEVDAHIIRIADDIGSYLRTSELIEETSKGLLNRVFSSLGIREIIKDPVQLRNLLEDIAKKQTLSMLEQTVMFSGHPSYYKTALKMIKRMSGMVGPRSTARVDEAANAYLNEKLRRKDGKAYDGNFRMAVFKDPVAKYPFLTGRSAELEEADAVAYINDHFQREFSLRHGIWSFEQEAVYQYNHKGNKEFAKMPEAYKSVYRDYQRANGRDGSDMKIYPEDFGKNGFIIPPLKPFFFGKFNNHPGMIKTAFVNVDQVGDKIVDISNYMSEHKLDIISFPTAVKIGVETNDDLFIDGNLTTEAPKTVIEAPHEFLGNQVSNRPKHKTKVSSGSQQLKIVLDGLFADGQAREGTLSIKLNGETTEMNVADAYNLYLSAHQAMFTKETAKLKEELGITSDGKTMTIDLSNGKLIEALTKQANDRGLASNIVAQIADIGKYGIDNLNEKLQNVLMKMIDNAIRDVKTHGNGYFQHTGTLARREDNYFDNGKQQFNGSDLKFYRQDPETGETLPMEVYLPWWMESEMSVEGVDPAGLELYGFRIPTQDINSLDAMVVKGFLPREAGNMVIVPTEYFKKNGSDADGDKLFIHIPNLTNDGKLVEWKDLSELEIPSQEHKKMLITQNTEAYKDYLEAGTDEAIDDIFNAHNLELEYRKILKSNPDSLQSMQALQNRRMQTARSIILDKSNFDNLTRPLDVDIFKNIAEELDEIADKKALKFSDLHNPIRMMSQTRELIQGKQGIGVAATQRTSHIQSAIDGAKINFRPSRGFPGLPNGTYSLGRATNEDGDSISTILSDYINIFVDAASDPMLKTLNLGIDTAGMAAMLMRTGASPQNVIYFLNQPVVKDYFRYKKMEKSALFKSQGKRIDDVQQLLLARYGIDPKTTAAASLTGITTERLKKGLTNAKALSKNEILGIIDTLFGKTGLISLTGELDSFIRKTDLDRKSPGKNIAEFLIRIERKNEFKLIAPGSTFDSDSFIGNYKDNYIQAAGMLSLLSSTFSEQNYQEIEKMLEKTEKYAVNTDERISVLTNYIKHKPTYHLQNFLGVSERERLLFGDNSIAHRLEQMKKDPDLIENEFLKTLTPSITPMAESNINGILHIRENANGFAEDAFVDAFEELLSHERSDIAEFGQDLVKAAILMYGVGTSPIGYSHLIPHEYMRQLYDQSGYTVDTPIDANYTNLFLWRMLPPGMADKFYEKEFKDHTGMQAEANAFRRPGDLQMGISNVNFENTGDHTAWRRNTPIEIPQFEEFVPPPTQITSVEQAPAIPVPTEQFNVPTTVDINDGEVVSSLSLTPTEEGEVQASLTLTEEDKLWYLEEEKKRNNQYIDNMLDDIDQCN